MKVTLKPVEEEDRPELEKLVSGYIDELNEIIPVDPFYRPNLLKGYWKQSDKHPFLIIRESSVEGFALVRTNAITHLIGNYGATVIEQFFIAKDRRRKGAGKQAAMLLFEKFKGKWEIYTAGKNTGAMQFWRSVIAGHTKGKYNEKRDDRLKGYLQWFDNNNL